MDDLRKTEKIITQARDVANLAKTLTPGVPLFSGEDMLALIRAMAHIRLAERDAAEAREIELQDEADRLRAELYMAKHDGRDFRDFDLSLEEYIGDIEKATDRYLEERGYL